MDTFDYRPLTLDSEKDFLPYHGSGSFGDVTFRALYAWQPIFGSRYTAGQDHLLLCEQSLSGEQMHILLRKPGCDPETVLSRLMQQGNDRIQLEFVSEEELPEYENTAARLGLRYSAVWDDSFSDYYYRKEDYCSLSGRRQKSLRGDVNALLKQVPDIRAEVYTDAHAPLCLAAFDSWCSGRSCENCVYGCERKVFERFLQTYREPDCVGALAFSGDRLLSFLIGELLPGGILDIHFQKSTVRQRGLMYWLSRETALRFPECRWIDLEEDMGLPGIRMDKQRLHPYMLKKKYTVILEPEKQEHTL